MYVEPKGLVCTNLPFPLLSRGKVRDIYDLGDSLLIVATDRMSAFDRVLDMPVLGKGKVLTRMTNFWMRQMEDLVRNHIIETDSAKFPGELSMYAEMLKDRAVLARKASPLPLEFIVRGYITGSAWKSYQETGMVNGVKMPEGLLESQKLPEPMFTPSTKADAGAHDENISVEKAKEIAGADIVEKAGQIALRMYERAERRARERGIIIADTKFEFGLDENGELMLIDEVLTPDSSRFWDGETYEPGKSQKSFDKQPLRDWIRENGYDIDPRVADRTSKLYMAAEKRVTG